MTYEDIREAFEKPKQSHPNEHIVCHRYGRMAVCEGNNIEPFIVDSDIAEKIENRSWCVSSGYPAVRINHDVVRLHDYVMSTAVDEKPVNCYVDHINQDKMDNRRQNLRFVTPTKSSQNLPLRTNNTSGYTGISKLIYDSGNEAYRAYITINRKRIELGHFKSIDDAINARREAENRYGFDTRPGTVKEKCERYV